jgi:DNA repair exonuclease SbcCD nuclease subunit
MSPSEEEDVVLKVLHTADWHLGRRFQSFDEEDERKLTRARIEAVERLLHTADQYQVDAMLCAGDLFDQPNPPSDAVEALLQVFRKQQRWTGPILLLPGNHDPLTPTSVYRENGPMRNRLPDHVHVVDRDDFTFSIGDNAVVYAVPCRSQSGQDDPTLKIPKREPDDDRIRIGMVHGQTFHYAGYETNFPIGTDATKRCELDYMAIGDTHSFRNVADDGTPPMVYPSAPEPTTFGEKDAGFAALVLFRRRPRGPTVRQEAIARWKWSRETCRSLEAVRELMARDDLNTMVLKLTLDLKVTVKERHELEQLLVELKGSTACHGKVGILRIDSQRIESDTSGLEDELAGAPEVLRKVAAELRAAEGEDQEVATQALQHLYRLVRELQ